MEPSTQPGPTVIIIFGAGGDLTWRKLVPALYSLQREQWLPGRFAIIGLDRKPMGDEEFRLRLRGGADRFSRGGRTDDGSWNDFAARVSYFAADFESPGTYAALAGRLREKDLQWDAETNCIYYLATPPEMIEIISRQLAASASNSSSRPASDVPTPARSFSASPACIAPTTPTSGANTPIVAQRVSSSSSPSPNRQWRPCGRARSRSSTMACGCA